MPTIPRCLWGKILLWGGVGSESVVGTGSWAGCLQMCSSYNSTSAQDLLGRHSLAEPSLPALKCEEGFFFFCIVGTVSWNISGYAFWCVCFISSLEHMSIQTYKSMPTWILLFKTQISTNLTLFYHQKLKRVVSNARLKPPNRLTCKRRLFW